jgi:ATP-dependent protease ClpP protease subunit
MELKFSKIVNRDHKKAEMYLYGTLGSYQGEINGHYFAEELAWMGRSYDEITIRVNCDGGEVLHGLSIVSEMMSSKAFLIVSVDGIAASMGAVLLAAADKVTMNDYAKVMIHSPYFVDENGDAVKNLSEKAKKGLASLKDILSKLLEKRGIASERVAELMITDSWFGADEALTEKLVDEVITTGRKSELIALEPKKLVAQLVAENINVKPNNLKSMKRIAARFGLAEDASEDAILAKVTEQENAGTTKMVDQMVKIGRELGTVTDENEAKVKRLAKADFDLAAEMYLKAPVAEVVEVKTDAKKTLIVDSLKKGADEKAKTEKKFNELSETEVETLRATDRPAYALLFKAHYGFEPTFE